MAEDTLSALQSQAQRTQQSQSKLAGLTGGAGVLPGLLRQAVTERFSGSPLYGAREKAAEQVITGPTRSREQLAGLVQAGARGEEGGAILSPTQQQAILTARRAADVVPLLSLNELLQAQTGGLEGLISGGISGYNALVQAAQTQAQSEQNVWDMLFKQSEWQEGIRQWEEEMELEKQKEARLGADEGGIWDLLASLGMGGMGTQAMGDYGEAPQYSPLNVGETAVNDEGVVWEFGSDFKWYPLGRM